jgi:uncharacterized protein
MLVDVNLLLYATQRSAPEHRRATTWWEEQLNGSRQVGLPWDSLVGYVRLVTNPRVMTRPLGPEDAWAVVEEWLAVPVVWIPGPTDAHARVLGELITKYRLSGKLIPDGHLAALAIEHGGDVCSADTDFARFTEVRWVNPLSS